MRGKVSGEGGGERYIFDERVEENYLVKEKSSCEGGEERNLGKDVRKSIW